MAQLAINGVTPRRLFSGTLGSGNNFNSQAWEPRLTLIRILTEYLQPDRVFGAIHGGQRVFPLVPADLNSPIVPRATRSCVGSSGMPTFGSGLNNNQNSGGCCSVSFLPIIWAAKGRHGLSFEQSFVGKMSGRVRSEYRYIQLRNGTTSLPDSPNFGSRLWIREFISAH